MVIISPTLFARARGGDRFWKRRRILSLSAHFFGRKQNCYSIAIKYVHRALRFGTRGRVLKKRDRRVLWDTQINAGCQEHGVTYTEMKTTMDGVGVALDRKVLHRLAVCEPRSFRALALLTKAETDEGLNSIEGPPNGVVTRGML